MKYLLPLILLASCSSRRAQEHVPPYSKEKVCSSEALEYIQVNKKLKTGPNIDTEYVRSKMLTMQSMAKSCFDDELNRGGLHHHFNLCFVTGFDSKGEQEYINFNTNEVKMSSEFYECLYAGAKKADFSGLKDLTVIQHFTFRPATKN